MRTVPRKPMLHVAAALLAALFCCGPATALTLDLPASATETAQDARSEDSLLLPTGPRSGGGGEGFVAEGRVTRQAWLIPRGGVTPFQLLAPLKRQLEDQGFEVRYECRDRTCGGFDFRLALDLLGAPAMHVDLGDYRYLAATRETEAGVEAVSIVTSTSAGGGHIHLTRVAPADAADSFAARTGASDPTPEPDGSLAQRLDREGHVVLEGLTFRPGSSELGDGPFPALSELADWLTADADRTVVLVGHSDNIGGLEDNIRLSERRATSVAEMLVRAFGIPRGRISARGVGYLAPIAPNETEEGRRLNRRVEAVVGAP